MTMIECTSVRKWNGPKINKTDATKTRVSTWQVAPPTYPVNFVEQNMSMHCVEITTPRIKHNCTTQGGSPAWLPV